MNGNKMNPTSKNLNLQPDLYSRNLIISEGIKKFKADNNLKKLRVLDVGGRGGKLESFLDDEDELTILDIRAGKEKNLIVGDATKMSFPDNSFDIITSGDVFEHIPPEKRKQFVTESLRVAKHLVILAAPFDEGENTVAEKELNQFFYDLTGAKHEWLEEHIENGLPNSSDLEKILKADKFQHKVIFSNSIVNWKLVQFFIFSSFYLGLPDKYSGECYSFYNRHIKEIENVNDSFYRRIYFIGKDGKFDFDFSYKYKKNVQLLFMSIVFSSLACGSKEIIRDRDKHIDELRKEITRLAKVASEASHKQLTAEKELGDIKDGKLYKLSRKFKSKK